MLDPEVINPFVKGAIDAIKVQGGLNIEHGKPFLKGKEQLPPISIAAQLGLASASFQGVLALCFEEQAFLKILSNMFGEEIKEITSDNQDGAAEILNMVYGAAKAVLNPKGYTFERAIPMVVRGADLQTTVGKQPAIVIPLRSDFGFIFIEIAVQNT